MRLPCFPHEQVSNIRRRSGHSPCSACRFKFSSSLLLFGFKTPAKRSFGGHGAFARARGCGFPAAFMSPAPSSAKQTFAALLRVLVAGRNPPLIDLSACMRQKERRIVRRIYAFAPSALCLLSIKIFEIEMSLLVDAKKIVR